MTETKRETPYFTTPDGQRWPIRVTPPLARRVRDTLGLDLFAVTAKGPANPFARLADDQLLLADVLWSILQPLADERQIGREAFETQVWEVLDDASKTLLAGVVESFPEQKRRALKALIAAQDAALDRVLGRLTPQIDALIDAAVEDAVADATKQLTRTPSPPA
jgi:hypothetical protein